MALQCIKRQLVLFGNFRFPVNADTSLQLMTELKGLDLIPRVVHGLPTHEGLGNNVALRKVLALFNDLDFQVIFNDERIDFVESLVTSVSEEADLSFIKRVTEIINRLSQLSAFSRVGFISEGFDFDLPQVQHEVLIDKYCPQGKKDNLEWRSRWVQKKEVDAEILHVCLDLTKIEAGLEREGVVPEPYRDSLRVLVDLSTSNKNSEARFNKANLADIINLLQKEAYLNFSTILNQ